MECPICYETWGHAPNCPKGMEQEDSENETTEMWREVRKEKQERHAKWFDQNKKLITASGLKFTDKGEALLFREPGKPKVDFYPSTGRWKAGNRFMRGGAKAFLDWYAKQNLSGSR